MAFEQLPGVYKKLSGKNNYGATYDVKNYSEKTFCYQKKFCHQKNFCYQKNIYLIILIIINYILITI